MTEIGNNNTGVGEVYSVNLLCYLICNYYFDSTESSPLLTSKVDIYSFGMCALEMAALEIQGNGDSGTLVTEDHINRTIESLEQDETPLHDFIQKCLHRDIDKRPTARELLFHPVLFEVPSLKLLAAHALVQYAGCQNLCTRNN